MNHMKISAKQEQHEKNGILTVFLNIFAVLKWSEKKTAHTHHKP